jgi:hypothetical protein
LLLGYSGVEEELTEVAARCREMCLNSQVAFAQGLWELLLLLLLLMVVVVAVVAAVVFPKRSPHDQHQMQMRQCSLRRLGGSAEKTVIGLGHDQMSLSLYLYL